MCACMRLQKAIARGGICSRRKAEDLINKGNVLVNGQIAKIGMRVDPKDDKIIVLGKELAREDKVYIAFNKPKGVISTVSDEQGRKNMLDFVNIQERLVPVGRLDKDTTGLLLLTNDGDIVNILTHPSFEHEKQYELIVEIPHDWNKKRFHLALKQIEKGVTIAGNFYTSPARVKIVAQKSNDRFCIRITIHEGHKHQVRQMASACGMSVIYLKRIQVGPIKLGTLPEGEFRYLSDIEIESLQKSARNNASA